MGLSLPVLALSIVFLLTVQADRGTRYLNPEQTVSVTFQNRELLIQGDGLIDRDYWTQAMRDYGLINQGEIAFDKDKVNRAVDKLKMTKEVQLPRNSNYLFMNFKQSIELDSKAQRHIEKAYGMFRNAGNASENKWVKADMETWDMSRVKDFSLMFSGAAMENVNIYNWDTSSAIYASEMFNRMSLRGEMVLFSYPGHDVQDEVLRKSLYDAFYYPGFSKALVEWTQNGKKHYMRTGNVSSVVDIREVSVVRITCGIPVEGSDVHIWANEKRVLIYGSGRMDARPFEDARRDPVIAPYMNTPDSCWNDKTKGMTLELYTEPNETITMENCRSPFRSFKGKVDITGNFSLGNRKEIKYFFAGCRDLHGLDRLDVSGIENMSYAFEGARVTEDCGIRKWDLSSVTKGYSMFKNATIEKGVEDLYFLNLTGASRFFYGAKMDGEAVSSWRLPNLTETLRIGENAKIDGSLNLLFWGTDWTKITTYDALFRGAEFSALVHPYYGVSATDNLDRAGDMARVVGGKGMYLSFDEAGEIQKVRVFDGSPIIPNGVKGGFMVMMVRDVDDGFLDFGSKRSYLRDGKLLTGWFTVDGKSYFQSNDTGMLLYGRNSIYQGQRECMFDLKTGEVLTGYFDVDGERLYYDGEQGLAKGWKELDGHKYYFVNGARVTGFQKIDGLWYHFGDFESPYLSELRGFRKIGAHYYHFDADYSLHTGWLTRGDNRYYMDGKGRRQYGFRFIGSKLYYFGEKREGMLRPLKGFQKIGEEYYYYNLDGSLYRGWLNVGGKKYRMDGKGRRMHGFRFVDGKLWYFGPKTDGAMRQLRGFRKIGNEYYHYDQDHSLHRGWLTRKDGTYYMDGKGRRVSGFRFVGKKLYYFGPKTDGKLRQLRGFRKIGKHYYHYDKDHSLHRGWLTRGDKRYYMNGKGIRAYGIWKVGDKRYYFGDEKTGYLRTYTGWKTIGGKKYYFNKDHSIK